MLHAPEGFNDCETSLKNLALFKRWCATMRGMPKTLKPLIVIVLAAVLAIGAAVYFSRRPAEQPSTATAGVPTLVNGGGHLRGPADAKITLVEFGDYQCPSCGAYHPVVKELLARYPQQVRLEFHHYPLISIHANAMAAAIAVEAAGEQGRYWEMNDLVFERQPQWSESKNAEQDFLAMASRLGLDQNAFMRAMRSPAIQDRILMDVVRAREAQVEAVPTFFIDGQQLHVPLSISAFVDIIEGQLKNPGSKAPSAANEK